MKKIAASIVAALFTLWAGPALANLSCGIPPIPPIGCKVGVCVGDKNGNNCQWTFVCG